MFAKIEILFEITKQIVRFLGVRFLIRQGVNSNFSVEIPFSNIGNKYTLALLSLYMTGSETCVTALYFITAEGAYASKALLISGYSYNLGSAQIEKKGNTSSFWVSGNAPNSAYLTVKSLILL